MPKVWIGNAVLTTPTILTNIISALLISWFIFGAAAKAQEASFDPVPMAWSTVRPLYFHGDTGEIDGAGADLARALAEEIGFELRPFRVPDFPNWAAAQTSGGSALLPLVAKLPQLSARNLFSDLVVQTNVRLAVTIENSARFDASDLTGRRIAVTSPGIGSDPTLLPGATLVNFANVQAALMGLLAGDVDALSTEAMFVVKESRAARIDHRITFVGPPLTTVSRFVAIHESRAELLEPINTVIAKMRADGRLDTILHRNNVTVPPAPADVLTVGVTQFPPQQFFDAGGTATGFAVEVLRDLAAQIGVTLNFVPITRDDWRAGPSPQTYDILPQTSISDARREHMDFTFPLQQDENSLFVLAENAFSFGAQEDLRGLKVGAQIDSQASRAPLLQTASEVVIFQDRDDLIDELLAGYIDAVAFAKSPFLQLIERRDLSGEIEIIDKPLSVITRAPALRFGLGQVREQLNAVIPAYLVSEDYASLRQEYFGEPVFWTRFRIYLAFGSLAAMSSALILYLLWQQQRQTRLAFALQQRDLEKEQIHTEKLSKLVLELERSNRELDEFAYTASHDLKEPLRGISINADFLAREPLSEKGQGRVDRMVSLAARMEKLVSDLLFFSRLGRGEKVMKDVDTDHIIEGIEKELKEWMAERDGEISVTTSLPWIHAERSKVKTVFQNLIVNALKYNDQPQKIVEIGFDAKTYVDGQTLVDVFRVRDNGIGISQNNRDKVFRIFQRLNREEAYGPGTGAGLSFVRKIIEEYDGVIIFTSKPGQGTTFYFSFPLATTGGLTQTELKGQSDDGHIGHNFNHRRQPG